MQVRNGSRLINALLAMSALGAIAGTANAASVEAVVPCSIGSCTYAITEGPTGGTQTTIAQGTYSIDPTTGALNLNSPVNWHNGSGASASLGLSGNSDPILGFSFAAGTGAIGDTFALSLSMPIALAGEIDAQSQVSYSLTGTTSAGAQIQPLFAHIVTAQESSTVVGGPAAFNKGVDVGNTFSFTGSGTQSSPVYSAQNMFALAAGNQYNLMSVTIAFTLSPNSNVGLSGFVEQTPVPLPPAVWLLLSGALGIGFFGRPDRGLRHARSRPSLI